jgi:hypothetical protein
VEVSKTTGLAGIAYWINSNYHLEGDQKVDKRDALVVAMKEWVDKEYEDGRITVLSNHELEEKIAELSGNRLVIPHTPKQND